MQRPMVAALFNQLTSPCCFVSSAKVAAIVLGTWRYAVKLRKRFAQQVGADRQRCISSGAVSALPIIVSRCKRIH